MVVREDRGGGLIVVVEDGGCERWEGVGENGGGGRGWW